MKKSILLSLAIFSTCGYFIQPVAAQIKTDGSTATQVKGNVISPIGKGTVNNGNLFNSFNQFNVTTSGVVFSTGNSRVNGASINNIINRVTGDTPSSILGTIQSRQAFPNANVYLINPNGIVFGQNAQLNIGGSFYANTGTGLTFSNNQTLSVDKTSTIFPSGNPQSIQFAVTQPAGIINQGNLQVDIGKSITLTGGTIINTGTLTAPGGNIALTSVAGNSQVELRSPDAVLGLTVTSGTLSPAWSGKITDLSNLAALLSGQALEANQVVIKPDGSLALVANPTVGDLVVKNGTTAISGKIDVSSLQFTGGNVGIFGNQVGLVNAKVDASGLMGGGTVLIGGNQHGNGVQPNALQTYVDPSSVIDVSAILSGNAGKAIVWADQSTQFLGSIAANAGLLSGNGGFVEVSGKESLEYNGSTSALAPNGIIGTLLLDPANITVVASGGTFPALTSVNNAANPDVGADTLNASLINSSLSNVILAATNNITINQAINIAASGVSFTAQAGNNINLNAGIKTIGGAINLTAGGNIIGSGTIASDAPISGNAGNVNLNASGFINVGNISAAVPAVNPNGNAGNITLQAVGNITVTAGISSTAINSHNGGKISLISSSGAIDTSLSSVSSPANSGGNGGDILYQAAGNITTGSVISYGLGLTGNGGNISFISGGAINTSGATYSYSANGNAGNISFQAASNIITGSNLDAKATGGIGGQISLITTGGSINTSLGYLRSLGTIAGSILLQASGNITTSNTYASGTVGNSGNITFISSGGYIDASLGSLQTTNNVGNAGNITLQAAGNITVPNVSTSSFGLNGNGGKISFTTTGGSINTTAASNSYYATSGDMLFQANGNINLGNTSTQVFGGTGNGGNITAISTVGSITTGLIASESVGGNSGNVLFQSVGDITASGLLTNASTSGKGGNVSLITTGGSIFLNNQIIAEGGKGGGNVLLQAAGNITTPYLIDSITNTNAGYIGGNISLISSGGSINDSLGTLATYGGNILLQASGNIITSSGGVLSYSPYSNNGGQITITSTNGSVVIGSSGMSSNSIGGSAGNISITAPNGNISASNVYAVTSSTSPASTAGAISLNAGLNLSLNGTISNTAVAGKAGDLILGGSIALTSNKSFSTTSGNINGNIDFSNASFTGNHTLTVNAGTGNISLGAIGTSSTPLAGLNLIGTNITLYNNIYTTNALTFSSPVTLGVSSAITSGNNITFNNTINGNQALALNSGSNSISFNGIVGGITPLASLLTNTNSTITSTGSVDIRTLGNITIGNVSNSGRNISLKSNNGAISTGNLISTGLGSNGGNIVVNASDRITTGAIDSSSNTGVGGNITLDPINNITITSANTSGAVQGGNFSATSTGGNIRILGFVSSPFAACAGASICTAGGTGGAITINYGGLNSFVIGDASINGSAGIITNGLYNLNLNRVILNIPGTFDLDNIAISPGGSLTVTPVTLIPISSSNFTSSPTVLAIVTVDGTAILKSQIEKNESYTNEKTALAINQHDQASQSLQSGNVAEAIVNLESSFTSEIEAFTGGSLPSSESPTSNSPNATSTTSNNVSNSVTNTSINLASNSTTGTASNSTTGTTTDSTTNSTTGSASNSTTGTTSNSTTNSTTGSASNSTTGTTTDSTNNSTTGSTPNSITGSASNSTTGTTSNSTTGVTTDSTTGTTSNSTTGVTTDSATNSTTGSTSNSTTGAIANSTTDTTSNSTTGSSSKSDTLSSNTNTNSSSAMLANIANTNLLNTQKELNRVSSLTGSPTSIVYSAIFDDRLEIMVVLPDGKTVQKTVKDSSKKILLPVIKEFRKNLLDPTSEDYLVQSKKLYDWLIRPIESVLEAEKITTLVFIMDGDLRIIPPAALHDGNKFLIEKYAIASVPSLRLAKLEERDRKNSRVLAMGLTEAREGFSALPAVNVEIGNIVGTDNTPSLLVGKSFINEPFTIPNMQSQRKQQDYGIIHLATHANFLSNSAYGSFIQFYNDRLYLSDIPELNLNKPRLEMLTLSACQTAVGNNLGIAGLAVASGVRSVLASLWSVSDSGTVPLMLSFYSRFATSASKAIALQQAQLSLLHGEVKIENNKITGIANLPTIPLNTNSRINIKHPFFWSSFVLVGSWL